jgi:hypothetical protein
MREWPESARLAVAGCSGEGLVTDPTAGTQGLATGIGLHAPKRTSALTPARKAEAVGRQTSTAALALSFNSKARRLVFFVRQHIDRPNHVRSPAKVRNSSTARARPSGNNTDAMRLNAVPGPSSKAASAPADRQLSRQAAQSMVVEI